MSGLHLIFNTFASACLLRRRGEKKLEEVKKIIQQRSRAAGFASASNVHPAPEIPCSSSLLGVDLQAATTLAEAAAGELMAMATVMDPLWLHHGPDSNEIFNEHEYGASFNGGNLDPRPLGFSTEATRATVVIPTSVHILIDLLMDTSKWVAFFGDIVSRAMTIDVLSSGSGAAGAMRVMSAEYQLPSPLVPLRESLFVRYCRRQSDERTWVIVDFSLDSLLKPEYIPNCRRRPSGLVIQEMANNLLKVTWVEHVEVDDRATHDMYKMMVSCGMGFGARRWLAITLRQLDRMRCLTDHNNLMLGTQIQVTNILRLVERMTISFNYSTSGNPIRNWIRISENGHDVQIVGRVNTEELGMPMGVVFCASTSFWVPLHVQSVFDFLINDSSRAMWNILHEGGNFERIADIPVGRDAGNRITVFYVTGGQSSNIMNTESMCVQESCGDPTGAYLIYSPLSTVSVNMLAAGRDPGHIPILSSGFSIFPNGPNELTDGSLVTIAFQMHIDPVPVMGQVSPAVFAAVNDLVKTMENKFKNAMWGGNP